MPEAPGLTWNFWMISWVGLWSHSSSLISGCCSRSEALGVLVCLFTLECFGSSNSSKLLNSGILKTHMQAHEHTHHTVSPICKHKTDPFTACLLKKNSLFQVPCPQSELWEKSSVTGCKAPSTVLSLKVTMLLFLNVYLNVSVETVVHVDFLQRSATGTHPSRQAFLTLPVSAHSSTNGT